MERIELYEVRNKISPIVYVGFTRRYLLDCLNTLRHMYHTGKEHLTNQLFEQSRYGTKIYHIRYLLEYDYNSDCQEAVQKYCEQKNSENNGREYVFHKKKYKNTRKNNKEYKTYYERNKDVYLKRSRLQYANKVKHKKWYCKVCEIELMYGSRSNHLDSIKHMINLKKYID